jgi:MarR family transcriptional regulator, transcriptional regulator for hemolysin
LIPSTSVVERKEDDADRRAKAIILTPLGRAVVEQVEAIARDVRERTLAGLSERDVQTAIRVLDHNDPVLSPTAEERTP